MQKENNENKFSILYHSRPLFAPFKIVKMLDYRPKQIYMILTRAPCITNVKKYVHMPFLQLLVLKGLIISISTMGKCVKPSLNCLLSKCIAEQLACVHLTSFCTVKQCIV